MTAAFYAIGDFFEAFFDILPPIGMLMNYFFMAISTVLTIGWINYMIKNKKQEIGFNVTEEEAKKYPLV